MAHFPAERAERSNFVNENQRNRLFDPNTSGHRKHFSTSIQMIIFADRVAGRIVADQTKRMLDTASLPAEEASGGGFDDGIGKAGCIVDFANLAAGAPCHNVTVHLGGAMQVCLRLR
jgi:hypothetical protein